MKTANSHEDEDLVNMTTHSPAISLAGPVFNAAALGAVFTLASTVEASVIYHYAGTSIDLGGGTGFAQLSLDLDGIGGADFQGRIFRSSMFGSAILYAYPGNGVFIGSESQDAVNFSVSSSVGNGFVQGTSVFGTLLQSISNVPVVGNFTISATGVAGVRFTQPSSGPNPGNHFGWIRLRVGDFEGNGHVDSLTVIDWAYETNPDTSIHVFNAGVPEAHPGLMLLAAGGTGLAAWRLRRKTGQNQATP